jgi:hypothetical protein
MDFDELLQLLNQGPLALQVATSSEQLVPYVTRGFGAVLTREELRVVVIEAQAVELLATLRRTRRIAINLTHPKTFVGRQVKGSLVGIDKPSDEAAATAAEYLERFAAVVADIGLTRQQAQGMYVAGPASWVRMRPQHLFDQTPGTTAGRQL